MSDLNYPAAAVSSTTHAHPHAHTRVNMPACHRAQAHMPAHVSAHTHSAHTPCMHAHKHTTSLHTDTHLHTHANTPWHVPMYVTCSMLHTRAHVHTPTHSHAHTPHTQNPCLSTTGSLPATLMCGLKFLEAGAPGRGHPASDSQFVKQAGTGLCTFGSALCPLCGEVHEDTLAQTGQSCANSSATSGDSLGEALSKSVTRCNFRTTKIIKRGKKTPPHPEATAQFCLQN